MKFVLTFFILLSCGDNQFASLTEPDPAVNASKHLEDQKPDSAIEVLLDALGGGFKAIFNSVTVNSNLTEVEVSLRDELNRIKPSKPEAPNWVSILASAQAQKAGIDILLIVLELAKGESEESSASTTGSTTTGSEFEKLFPVLPAGTTENSFNLGFAITLLASIGSETLTKADNFKQGIFLTSRTALFIKSVDKDGDGVVSPLEVLDINDSSAEDIVDTLTQAIATIDAAGIGSGSRSETSANQIEEIKKQIEESEGETLGDKLRNFIIAK
ncbi:MAG: hypothetical protein HYW48_01405 [Deltaproteobacteria bacterium]|nr:hypothetical protein [Deltaproteobacteria bacterium]